MSRIGKQPIIIPKGVTITEKDRSVIVEGPRGTLSLRLPTTIGIAHEDARLNAVVREQTVKGGSPRQMRASRAQWGTIRALLANMVAGVTKGFEKRLALEGVGYRVTLEGSTLVFALGFSHPVHFEAPEGITFRTEKNTIAVSGNSKELVGRTASALRALKPPEPYKGKGIRYADEIIKKKAGKKAVGTT
ncbi:MAG: 50S ribosomal protein L6 [Patescibacteria group bacterium]|jgi:large subunit ribosomal protein L6